MKTGTQHPWRRSGLILLFIVLLAGFFSHRIAVGYTDWLWHTELGTRIVFIKVYGTRVFLFCVFGATSFLLAYFNVWLADRISPPASVPTHGHLALFPLTDGKPIGRTMRTLSELRHVLDLLLLVGAFAFAVAAGLSAQAQWDQFLRFTHPEPFHILDPQFKRDIGFYIFILPFLRFVQGWSLTITLLIGAGVAVVYLYQQGINRASGNMVVLPHVRGHLSVIVGTAFLIQAWGYHLDRYALLFGNGNPAGAFYTEIHVRLPFLQVLTVVAVLAAAASFVNLWRRTLVLPIAVVGIWFALSGIGLLWSAIYYRIHVIPDEARLEAPYNARSLQATRSAYGLDRISTVDLGTEQTLPAPSDRDLIGNFPVWDENTLQEVLYAQQGFHRFDTFSAPQTDRYRVGGRLRLFQIASREIGSSRLDGRAYTWPNLRLRYTHSAGAVAVAGNYADGSPQYVLSGLPPTASFPELSLLEPRLYFGGTGDLTDYVVVNASLPELDLAATTFGGDTVSRYQSSAGIAMTPFARLASAVRFAAFSLMFSQEVEPQSRLLFVRYVPLRVKRVVPFLLLDTTLCPVIADGRLFWIQNAFTTAGTYPYSALSIGHDNLSEPVSYNYIRPSATAVVDGYSGDVRLYVNDETDPILRSYRRIFPTLFHPLSEMPPSLRAHRRYPRELFLAQRRILAEYHTEDPATFYGRTDVWRIPQSDPTLATSASASSLQSEQAPYFALTRLGDSCDPEFVTLSSFTPQGKANLTALLLARNEGDHFGELVLYRFGTQFPLPGPEQMDRRVRTDPHIAGYFAQTDAVGAVQAGAMRIVPVAGKRLYYIQPFYVRPATTALSDTLAPAPPQLRQVVVATPDASATAATIPEAFNALLPTPVLTATSSRALSPAAVVLIQRASDSYSQAQKALRQGDFAGFGKANRTIGDTLNELRRLTVQPDQDRKPPSPKTSNP